MSMYQWVKGLFNNRATTDDRPSASADVIRTDYGGLHHDIMTLYFWHIARQDAERALAILYSTRGSHGEESPLPAAEKEVVQGIVANAARFYTDAIETLEDQITATGHGTEAVRAVNRREQRIELPGGYVVHHPAPKRYTRYTDMARYGRPAYRRRHRAPDDTE